MRTLVRTVSAVMVLGLMAWAGGCNTDSPQDRTTDQASTHGNQMRETVQDSSSTDAMLKSLGVGGSGVGAAGAAVPENSYVATTNPSSAEEAGKAKPDAPAQPAGTGDAQKPAPDEKGTK